MSSGWQARARELFLDALELEPGARDTFVLRAAAGDGKLLEEVRSLLACHDRAGDRFEPVGRRSVETLDDWIGEQVAGYLIEGLIAEGGMGRVYRARQLEPQRRVALKLIRPGLFGPEHVRRFRDEAQLLARLDHPGVAEVYAAGETETRFGPRHYLAMELIEGEDLLAHAEELSRRQRLELFTRVCDGVQHAHQRRVIHRDLKGANILIAAGGQPKLIDFGLARSLAGEKRDLETRAGELMGTLATMSPEQLEGDPALVDTTSDVYALGVILYQLLANRLPLELQDLPLTEAVRRVQEEPAPRLGTIEPSLGGDLETIATKALEKEPQRRYASASDLAADVRRFLCYEPITARPPSSIYQLRRFARRNRWLSAAFLVFVVSTLTALAGTALAQRRLARAVGEERLRSGLAERERSAADRARLSEESARRKVEQALRSAQRSLEVSNGVRSFAERLLTAPNPFRNPSFSGSDVRVLDVLRAYEDELQELFAERPHVEREVRLLLVDAYGNLGEPEAAQVHRQRAEELEAP